MATVVFARRTTWRRWVQQSGSGGDPVGGDGIGVGDPVGGGSSGGGWRRPAGWRRRGGLVVVAGGGGVLRVCCVMCLLAVG